MQIGTMRYYKTIIFFLFSVGASYCYSDAPELKKIYSCEASILIVESFLKNNEDVMKKADVLERIKGRPVASYFIGGCREIGEEYMCDLKKVANDLNIKTNFNIDEDIDLDNCKKIMAEYEKQYSLFNSYKHLEEYKPSYDKPLWKVEMGYGNKSSENNPPYCVTITSYVACDSGNIIYMKKEKERTDIVP